MSPLMKLTPHLLAPTGVPVLLLGLAASTGTVTLTATAAGCDRLPAREALGPGALRCAGVPS
jgi:hypothetical protein